MSDPNHSLENAADLALRFSSFHVDDQRYTPGPHHPSPNPTGFTPSLQQHGTAPNRAFAYPDPAEMYGYYQSQAHLHGPQLDPPFSPVQPPNLGQGNGFGYAPPMPNAGDMAGLMQNQFEYGQADPYGTPGQHGLGLGLAMGTDGMPMGLRGNNGQDDRQNGYRRDGQQRMEEPISPVNRGYRGPGQQRDGPPHHHSTPQQGPRRKMSDAPMPQGQGFGGYAQDGLGFWPVNNGTFVERGKKPMLDSPRPGPHSPLRGSTFNSFPNAANLTPLFSPAAVRNALGQYTPNTPGYGNPLVPTGQWGQQFNQVLRYQPNPRPRRFDDQPRSALLEDYRLNKNDRNWGLAEITGHIIEFSGDQHGSRLIQTKIEQSAEQDRQAMYLEILPNAVTLMTDVFGNYVIQKFFDFGSEEQVRGLAEKMRGNVLDLSMQMYGCRVVQKALEKVKEPQKLAIIAELEGKIVQCVKSANANHVVQRIIQCNPPKSVPNAFLGSALELSVHSYGCRVLQKAVEHLPDDHKQDLLEELHLSTRQLIEDGFGNYVVQSMIIAAGPDHRARVIQIIKGQVWSFSRHKFASNVVEKAILHAEPNDKRELVYELVSIREDGTNRVSQVLRDPYANFVLQTCLKSAERSQRQQLLDLIVPLMNTVRHTPPGKRLDALITEMQTEGFSLPPGLASGDVTLVNPSPDAKLPLNPLRRIMSNASAATEVDEVSTDLSRSSSSAPGHGNGRMLRPTASAPPRSDRLGLGAAEKGKKRDGFKSERDTEGREELADLLA